MRAWGLEPVEYPSTRRMGSTPRERADDLHAAFGDDSIAAVVASIGGDDQVRVIGHLDPVVFAANPKRFFGYSDNTNLLNFLHRCGVVGFHGGSVMVEFGRPVAMNPLSAASLRAAMFTGGPFRLQDPGVFGDEGRDWADAGTFSAEPLMRASAPWTWHGPEVAVEGPAWGGCLEVLDWIMAADRVAPVESFPQGGVLFLETSEEMPGAGQVHRMLRNMGERGLLARFGAVVLGRAKSWSFDRRLPVGEREEFWAGQVAAVLATLAEYRPGVPVVCGVHIGHTDPQQVLPYGGRVRVDGVERAVTVWY
ncbi:LD-carboxypeptidase [Actinorhabdospora filicis]|uniref:LD-carboxypeptidase n=2 Tax=Actinorhabdospora filicis TaxID=1785913 RepID=A0A9W6W9N0_9ACTN|nr:LD-carboxypeptidase [Actinorhabdospora filicis]